ncbi:MAG TPA: magnesium chelatase ATPase subunit I [Pyrinomonadaceae bacterium]|jgi:magnesium chelatase subunit D|nr:magnesium chelatase ATPase subunit I [Pyrinomonadaceae bacterium]
MTRQTDTSKKRSAQLLPARRVYPFAAIVGQEELKLGLLLNVIAPSIGGVLIMGHRGTGKSTAVRALAELLPPLSKVRGCLYGCDPAAEANFCADCQTRRAEQPQGALPAERAPVPVVDLPLNATEDRVAGAINLERAIKEGAKTFEPGLLARAHRGFLYIDEVNLLEDHLVDLLLDVAASGRNRVEREGVSIEHPSEFVLVGSGNPEEGELRPQLVDRFGLYTEIRTAADVEERVEIITRREAFDRDPAAFCVAWEREQARLRRRLVRARAACKSVRLSTELVRGIAELCGRLGVDGHRGELTIARASRALAAFENRREVAPEDVRRVASMALRHRLRRDPLEQTDDGSRIEQAADELFGANDTAEHTSDAAEPGATNAGKRSSKKTPPSAPDETGGGSGNGGGGKRRDTRGSDDGRAPQTQNEERPAPTLDARLPDPFGEKFVAKKSPAKPAANARRQINSRATSSHARGRYTRAVARRTGATGDLKIALDATLRVAAASQMVRRRAGTSSRAFEVETGDLRYKHFSRRTGTLFIFAVDTSGSMAHNRISQAKGALARLLRESYVRRDRVALITFRERAARVLLQPSGSSARACRLLDALPVGGATPLTSALLSALEMSERAARRGAARICLLVFTDGRANVPRDGSIERDRAGVRRQIKSEVEKIGVALQRTGVASVVVDTQNRFTRGGEGQALAQALGGRYLHLPALK